jgi:hypothetical protein
MALPRIASTAATVRDDVCFVERALDVLGGERTILPVHGS